MPNICCVMMQKDEEALLEAWCVYHGYLFGFENLFIFDNGSSSETTRSILQKFEAIGVNVDRSFDTRADFERKGEIVSKLMRALDDRSVYDFLIPIDCDEFVCFRHGNGFSFQRSQIHEYLSGLRNERQTLEIKYCLANVPDKPGWYVNQHWQKTFYAGGTFGHTDLGYHHAGSRLAKGLRPTSIHYVHFHNRKFSELVSLARNKLNGRIDTTDLAALASYKGPGLHLVPYFSMSEADYIESFQSQLQLYCPDLINLLRVLGISNDVVGPCEQILPELNTVTDCGTMKGLPYVLPGEKIDLCVDEPKLYKTFNSASYTQINQDVASVGFDPLMHFCIFGHKEGRKT